jgi:glycosyltransferase involved in cell wall biosynthesis
MKIGLYSTTVFPAKPDLEGYGGLELIVGELAKYFDEHNHEVHLFAPLGSYQPKHGFLYSTGPPGSMDEVNAWKIYVDNPASKKILLDIDILHDHSWMYCPYALYKERNGRICKTHHGPDPGFRVKPPYEKNNLIGVSQNHAKNLTNFRWMNPDGTISSPLGCSWRGVQNGIDLARYPFKKEKQNYLLWVSRIFPPKGAHRFIDICDKLQTKGYVLGGSFGQDPEYMKIINDKLANSKHVTVVGKFGEAIPFEKKVEMYQNARAVVMPIEESYTVPGTNRMYNFLEPFGLIAPEANACGTPMVVCPSGGWNETTLHGYNGFLANSDDEFMYYIKRLDDIKAENCRKHAEYFSYERMALEYLHLYKEISEGRGW